MSASREIFGVFIPIADPSREYNHRYPPNKRRMIPASAAGPQKWRWGRVVVDSVWVSVESAPGPKEVGVEGIGLLLDALSKTGKFRLIKRAGMSFLLHPLYEIACYGPDELQVISRKEDCESDGTIVREYYGVTPSFAEMAEFHRLFTGERLDRGDSVRESEQPSGADITSASPAEEGESNESE